MTDTQPEAPIFKPLKWDIERGRTRAVVTNKSTNNQVEIQILEAGKQSSDGSVLGYACKRLDTKDSPFCVIDLGDTGKYHTVLHLCVDDAPPTKLYKDAQSPACTVNGRQVLVLAEGGFYETKDGQLFMLDSLSRGDSGPVLHGLRLFRCGK